MSAAEAPFFPAAGPRRTVGAGFGAAAFRAAVGATGRGGSAGAGLGAAAGRAVFFRAAGCAAGAFAAFRAAGVAFSGAAGAGSGGFDSGVLRVRAAFGVSFSEGGAGAGAGVERFFAIYLSGAPARTQKVEFTTHTHASPALTAEYNPLVTEAQQPRSEPREIAELRRLKSEQPDLASAADLQIELLQLQRRINARLPLPSIKLEPAYLATLLASGHILQFDHLKIDWSDLRFLVRAVAAAMRTYEALDPADLKRVELITRDAERLPRVARAWYDGTSASGEVSAEVEGLETVLLQAMRPSLSRAAEAIQARVDLTSWQRGSCPVCGGEPDLAVIMPSAERLLICGRCAARWRFDQIMCPFCRNADRARITSFTSRDGRYRLSACDVCERYLKAYDARNAARPVMPPVDLVATLPLDAAAMQRGYK